MKKIVIINGPNLDLLGERQPEIYGKMTLAQINKEIKKFASGLGFSTEFHQSNSEGEIIKVLHKYRKGAAGIIINAAGYSHTSVAILDALLALEVPAVEVHLSNIYRREEFRQKSITAQGTVGIISGFGKIGYLMAVGYLAGLYKE
jgi:3-dehydroquinate dehydratase-2